VSQLAPSALLGRAFATRAEQLRGQVFDLFTEPNYFPELLDSKSCVLFGGRGTGKTTALRGLSFEGQASLTAEPPSKWTYFGVYIRANTARVTAFSGDELTEAEWTKLFSHYWNLLHVQGVVEFLTWFEGRTGVATLTPADCLGVALSLGADADDELLLEELARLLRTLRRELELYVNNVVDGPKPRLSILGGPIDEIMELVVAKVIDDRPFFFLIDEYENLSPQQQRVANTLVKHAGTLYAFKIGVKELGWRSRSTLNAEEQLQSPADYAQIDIAERLDRPGAFAPFAERICDDRLRHVATELGVDRVSTATLLPGLTEDAEADLLGVDEHIASIRKAILAETPEASLDAFDALPALYQYLIGFWATSQSTSASIEYADYLKQPAGWDTRYGNYKHSLLYTLRAGRRGIRKYYSGFDTYREIAGTNLRFLVQLVEQALRDQLNQTNVTENWLTTAIPPDTQTKAARAVAQRNLVELEGLSLIGPRLTRLTVGLGRVFQLMAADPGGHTPEVTQFRISGSSFDFWQMEDLPDPRSLSVGDTEDARGLIAEAITHLAIRRLPGTKLSGTLTREHDYMLHPIFAPVFDCSYRRKRKMTLTREQILGLVAAPSPTVQEILKQSGRVIVDDGEALPDQMHLFDAYLRTSGG
jgi:hypothetical protein